MRKVGSMLTFGIFESIQLRYFELKSSPTFTVLIYKDEPQSRNFKGQLQLTGNSSASSVLANDRIEIRITEGNRTLVMFDRLGFNESNEWLHALQEHIRYASSR